MKQRICEGILSQDNNGRYCLHELDMSGPHILTCTSGCPLEVWFDHAWVAGHVEGDGQDYWLFATTGGKFLLAEQMKARYRENALSTW